MKTLSVRLIFYILMLRCQVSELTSASNTTTATSSVPLWPAANSTASPSHNQITLYNSQPTNVADTTEESMVRAYVLTVLYAIIFIIGITGNILVLLTVSTKQMRSVTNIFLGNLAVADLITCLLSLPIIVMKLYVDWPLGKFVCLFIYPLTDVFVSVSVCTLCAIMLDRFRGIVYPFTRKLSLKMTLLVTAAIWILSIAIVGIPLMVLYKFETVSGQDYCHMEWPSKAYSHSYRLAIFIFLYIIPVSLIFFCYICIHKNIRKNLRLLNESVSDRRQHLQGRSRIVKLMFVIFITFAICMLPIQLYLVIYEFYKPTESWQGNKVFNNLSLFLLFANSCMNPIILCIMSSVFRENFKKKCLCFMLFRKCKNRRNDGNGFDEAEDENQTPLCMTSFSNFRNFSSKKTKSASLSQKSRAVLS
eukprot:gene7712-8550_t